MSRPASPASPPPEVFVTLRWDHESSSSADPPGPASYKSTRAAAQQGQGRPAGDANGRGDEDRAALRARVEELEGVVATTGAELALKDAELAVALQKLERRQLRIEALKHELEEVRKDVHAELTKKELLIESLHADIEELQCAHEGLDADPKLEEHKCWFQLSDYELSDSDSGDEAQASLLVESVPAKRDAAVVEQCCLGPKRMLAGAEKCVVFKTQHGGGPSGVLCKPAAQLRYLMQMLEKRDEDPWVWRACKGLFGGWCRVVLFFNPWLRVVRWLVCSSSPALRQPTTRVERQDGILAGISSEQRENVKHCYPSN